jgi:hypothetical protein
MLIQILLCKFVIRIAVLGIRNILGPIPLTNGSGRPKYILIRIPNTVFCYCCWRFASADVIAVAMYRYILFICYSYCRLSFCSAIVVLSQATVISAADALAVADVLAVAVSSAPPPVAVDLVTAHVSALAGVSGVARSLSNWRSCFCIPSGDPALAASLHFPASLL